MQCTSYIPMYYHARDPNAGGSGFTWHPFDGNANCGEQRSCEVAMPTHNMDSYLCYDKEALKQIIQNHEAAFRYQVQELHRLYRRQRELMDEMRVREIFAQHLLSQTSETVHSVCHARPDFSQTPLHTTSWLLGDHSRKPDSLIRRNSYNNVEFDQGKQFKEENVFESAWERPNFKHSGVADTGSLKSGDFSCFYLKSRKTDCFIDLNEPIPLESLSSSSSGHFESSHMDTKFNYPCVPEETKPESVVPKTNCHDCSDGVNSSLAIDLNSMPLDSFPEREIIVENLWSTNKDAAMKKDKSVEDHLVVHKMNDKFVKSEIEIDLNMGIQDEHSLPLSSPEIKPAEETELEGPVSPEKEECSPPRGESEDILVETPGLSELQGKGELSAELDTIAAQTLVMIFSGVEEYTNTASLCWFAEIVSSTGDDLENGITKLENVGAVKKVNETDSSASKSVKGRKRGIKQRKGCHAEVLTSLISLSEDTIKEFVETGPLKRKPGRKASGKPRKHSKLSSSDVIKTILKQPVTRSKQGVLHSWGRVRKRRGGRRRRPVSSFLLAELI